MKTVLEFDPKNAACRIQTSCSPSARMVFLASNKVTSKQCRKTRRGAAELLYRADELQARGIVMLTDEQRAGLETRANGGSSVLYRKGGKLPQVVKGGRKAQDESPLAKRKGEGMAEYIERINASFKA